MMEHRIEAIPDGVEVDNTNNANRLTQAPARITLTWEQITPLLRLNAPQEPTPEAVMAREEAGRIEVGRRIVYRCRNDSVTYEVEDWDGYLALLRRLTNREARA